MKTKMTLLLSIVISLFLENCTHEKSSKTTSDATGKDSSSIIIIDTVEIESHLKNGEKAYLYYYDYFQDITMPIEFKENMKKKIPFRKYLLIIDTEHQNTFSISKSEKLFISKDNNEWTILQSENLIRNDELNFITNIVYNNESFFSGKTNKISEVIRFIDTNKKSAKITQENIDDAKSIVNAINLQTLVSNSFLPHVKYSMSSIDSLNKLKNDFHNEDQIKNDHYRRALIGFCRFLARKSLNSPNEFKAVYDSTVTNFDGNIRDFLLFYQLNHVKVQNQIFKEYLQSYLKTSLSEDFKIYLTEKYLSSPKNSVGELISEKNESEDYSALLNKYKGKVIYIDFWASWCMPCRAEVPNSKKLINEFESKDLKFVTISMDENKVAWQKAIQFEQLNKTLNYQLVKNFESTLAKQFKISSIPRYIIIGKDGKVIDADAPRPSDPKIHNIFNELLKNK